MLSPKTVLRLSFVFVFLLSTATADTQITFPSFSPESHGDFMALGDAAYHPANRSYIMNAGASIDAGARTTSASRGSCGALLYGKTVHIQNGASARVASFSTSFSFKSTMHGLPWEYSKKVLEGTGFNFALTKKLHITLLNDMFSQPGIVGACRQIPVKAISKVDAFTPAGFSVHFEKIYHPTGHADPSNNFIRVGKNLEYEYDVEAYTHDLCGTDTHCSYFSNGRILTAWIDFDSSPRTLEIRMADGSDPKPSQPRLLISNYEFPKMIGDDAYLSFWGSSDVHRLEEHELLSWSFSSTEVPKSKLQLMLHYLRSWVSKTAGGILFGTLAASMILWSIFSFAKPSPSYSALGYSTGPRVFSYHELRKATQNFHERNLLGRGGSGVVYKGSFEGENLSLCTKVGGPIMEHLRAGTQFWRG